MKSCSPVTSSGITKLLVAFSHLAFNCVQSEKKHKKHKKEKKSKNQELLETATMAKWGAYGIIKESDMHSKQEEFFAWLSEVKGVSQDMCGRRELADYFSSFVEDYNTATLPSLKYYNMRKW